jgi:hypothetical protein
MNVNPVWIGLGLAGLFAGAIVVVVFCACVMAGIADDRIEQMRDRDPDPEPEDVTPLVPPIPWAADPGVVPLRPYRNGTPHGHRPAA